MNIDKLKVRVQRNIVSISVILLIAKFIAFFVTNSVGILTDAMESIVNVVAGFVSLYSLYYASKPKDERHPFGRGKVELISASLEGLLIFLAGAIIIVEGIRRLLSPVEIQKLDIGIILVAIAGLINFLLGWYSINVGKKHNSIALVAGGKHLQSDTYSSIGLVIGLILLYITKINWIDSFLAVFYGGIIVFTGIGVLRKTINNLMDKADSEILSVIADMISRNRKQNWVDVHNLKVVKYGSVYHVDCDLTLPWYYNIQEGHKACEDLEIMFNQEFTHQVHFTIHSDPCKPYQCSNCELPDCKYRRNQFEQAIELSVEQITKSDEANLKKAFL